MVGPSLSALSIGSEIPPLRKSEEIVCNLLPLDPLVFLRSHADSSLEQFYFVVLPGPLHRCLGRGQAEGLVPEAVEGLLEENLLEEEKILVFLNKGGFYEVDGVDVMVKAVID